MHKHFNVITHLNAGGLAMLESKAAEYASHAERFQKHELPRHAMESLRVADAFHGRFLDLLCG